MEHHMAQGRALPIVTVTNHRPCGPQRVLIKGRV